MFQDLTKGNPRFRPCLPPKAMRTPAAVMRQMQRTTPPHDYTDRTTAVRRGNLADTWRGDTDRVYEQMQDGSLRRVSPARPYLGKRERRRVILERRIDRIRYQQDLEFNKGFAALFKQTVPN